MFMIQLVGILGFFLVLLEIKQFNCACLIQFKVFYGFFWSHGRFSARLPQLIVRFTGIF